MSSDVSSLESVWWGESGRCPRRRVVRLFHVGCVRIRARTLGGGSGGPAPAQALLWSSLDLLVHCPRLVERCRCLCRSPASRLTWLIEAKLSIISAMVFSMRCMRASTSALSACRCCAAVCFFGCRTGVEASLGSHIFSCSSTLGMSSRSDDSIIWSCIDTGVARTARRLRADLGGIC